MSSHPLSVAIAPVNSNVLCRGRSLLSRSGWVHASVISLQALGAVPLTCMKPSACGPKADLHRVPYRHTAEDPELNSHPLAQFVHLKNHLSRYRHSYNGQSYENISIIYNYIYILHIYIYIFTYVLVHVDIRTLMHAQTHIHKYIDTHVRACMSRTPMCGSELDHLLHPLHANKV